MKLVPGEKLEKNLKLMRSCSRVRIIQLTEEIAKLIRTQRLLVTRNPDLRNMLTAELNRALALDGKPEIVTPQIEDLIGIALPSYVSSKEELPEVNQYMSALRKTTHLQKVFADHQALNKILSEDTISYDSFYNLVNGDDTTRSFKNFVDIMRKHSPMFLSAGFKIAANDLAKRNKIANNLYYERSNNTFTINDTAVSLGNDFKGRLASSGKKLTAGIALSALLVAGGFALARTTSDVVRGNSSQHSSTISTVPDYQQPIVAVSTEETPNISQDGIFSNSININSYKTACEDFFQKTAEVYKYNTGEDIDLSGYEQSDIAVNRSATILEVEKDGVIYRISTQSNSPSNPTYLREALDALGVSYTAYNSRTTCIIDKYDSTRSIAITDSQGNPVRSGNILEATGSGGYMYNQQMVQNGRKILEAEGRDSSALSEAECVAAYILSDSYNVQNPELSRALGATAGLADTIKSTFYYSGSGKDDTYAIYLYSQDSANFAQQFSNNVNGITQVNERSQDMEHDER